MKGLYYIETNGVDHEHVTSQKAFYVVAISVGEAYGRVRKYLDEKKLGTEEDRCFKKAELLAQDNLYPDCNIRLFL